MQLMVMIVMVLVLVLVAVAVAVTEVFRVWSYVVARLVKPSQQTTETLVSTVLDLTYQRGSRTWFFLHIDSKDKHQVNQSDLFYPQTLEVTNNLSKRSLFHYPRKVTAWITFACIGSSMTGSIIPRPSSHQCGCSNIATFSKVILVTGMAAWQHPWPGFSIGEKMEIQLFSTVDGRNPANQLGLVVYFHDLQGFIDPRWLFGISEPSTVCLPKGFMSPTNWFFCWNFGEPMSLYKNLDLRNEY